MPQPKRTLTRVRALAALVLLGGVAVQFAGGAAAQSDPTPTPILLEFDTPTPRVVRTAVPTEAPAAEPDAVEYAASDWQGGYLRDDSAYYGRPWTAVYGAQSDYPRATLVFSLARDPEEALVLTLEGLDDELPARNQITLAVNGQAVFEGEAWFADWDGVGNGANAAWTTVRITIPPGLLIAGENRITLANLTPSANFGAPPYVLVSRGTIESAEGDLFGSAAPDELEVTIDVG